MQHAYPLDDIDEIEPTAEEVQAQVEDWLGRLEVLFASIKRWAIEQGWQIEPQAPVTMHEAPMQRFSLDPVPLESFILHAPEGGKVWVMPNALWVIGANGRVDLLGTNGVYVLFDRAPSLAPPEWKCHRVGRGPIRPFAPEMIAQMA
jgi:hypothetical protein